MRQSGYIVTEWVYPPIPERSQDWSATFRDYDGAPDAKGVNSLIGRGPTELAAIADLLDQERELEESKPDDLIELEGELAELRGYVEDHNERMVKECLEWSCSERDHGERCPNCPQDHTIILKP